MPAVVHHQAAKQITGVVVSAGKMMKTVKVQIPKQKWNKRIQKYYATPYNVLVSDPTEAAREGDVVSIQAGYRTSKHVHHVIADIVAPMGPPLSQRPHVMTEAERVAALIAKREARDKQQAANGRLVAIRRVKERRQIEEMLSREQGVLDREEAQMLTAKAKALAAARGSAKTKEAEEYEILRREAVHLKYSEYQAMSTKLKALAKAQETAGEIEKKELEAQVAALVEARRVANAARQSALYHSKALPVVFTKALKYWGKDYADPSFQHGKSTDAVKHKTGYAEMVRDRMDQFFKPLEESSRTPYLKRQPSLVRLQDEIEEYFNAAKEAREQQKAFLHLYLKITEARVQLAQSMISILATDFNQPTGQDLPTTLDLRHMADEDVPKAIEVAAADELSRRKTKLEGLERYIATVEGNEAEYATKSAKWNALVIELGLSQHMKSLAATELANVAGVEQFGSHIRKWGGEGRRKASAARKAAGEAKAKDREAAQSRDAGAEHDRAAEAAAEGPDAIAQPESGKAEEVKSTEKKGAAKAKDDKKGVFGWLGL